MARSKRETSDQQERVSHRCIFLLVGSLDLCRQSVSNPSRFVCAPRLLCVFDRFVADVDTLKPELKDSVAKFMAFVHKSVNDMSVTYLQNDKRYNYTTPKSFLEQITLYKNLLSKKNRELQEKIIRLESGLVKLQSCARQVDDLKDKLAAQEVELKQKNEDADKLIKVRFVLLVHDDRAALSRKWYLGCRNGNRKSNKRERSGRCRTSESVRNRKECHSQSSRLRT